MPPAQDPLTVLQTLEELASIKDKAHRTKNIMCVVEEAAGNAIIEVINNYMDATYASLELPQSETGSMEADANLHEINASLARLKTGLPPVL